MGLGLIWHVSNSPLKLKGGWMTNLSLETTSQNHPKQYDITKDIHKIILGEKID